MAGTITLWDLYLQVKNFQLKKPADFMMLVLKDFPITCPGRFGISAYYMALFYWHYPFHFFSLLSASFQICTHKISGTYRQWKNKMNTFSPMARFYTEQAQDMIRRIEGGGDEVGDA